MLVDQPPRNLLDLRNLALQPVRRHSQRLVSLGREDAALLGLGATPLRPQPRRLLQRPDLLAIGVVRHRERRRDAAHLAVVGSIPLDPGRAGLGQARDLSVDEELGAAAGPLGVDLVDGQLQPRSVLVDLALDLFN